MASPLLDTQNNRDAIIYVYINLKSIIYKIPISPESDDLSVGQQEPVLENVVTQHDVLSFAYSPHFPILQPIIKCTQFSILSPFLIILFMEKEYNIIRTIVQFL